MIAALDLANGVTGIALVSSDVDLRLGPPLVWFGSMRGKKEPRDTARGVENTVRGAVQPLLDLMSAAEGRLTDAELRMGGQQRGLRVVIELPPPSAPQDGHHGAQAALGWSLGRLAGLVEARFERVSYVPVSHWRSGAANLVRMWDAKGLGETAALTPRPKRSKSAEVVRDDQGRPRVRWPCGHESDPLVPGLMPWADSVRTCGQCSDGKVIRRDRDRARERSDEWKELACLNASRFYPERYHQLVAGARSRATSDPPDHKLVGVADACEALFIALAEVYSCSRGATAPSR